MKRQDARRPSTVRERPRLEYVLDVDADSATFTSPPLTLQDGRSLRAADDQLETGGVATTLPFDSTLAHFDLAHRRLLRRARQARSHRRCRCRFPPDETATFYFEDTTAG